MTTRIKVIMPTFNRCQWLKGAIDSVLECPDADLLILDNGSTDQTTELLVSLGKTESRVAWIYQPENSPDGYLRLLNRLNAEDTYFAFMGDDDLMLPGGLTMKKDVLDRHPAMDMIFSRVKWMDEAGVDQGLHGMGAISTMPIAAGALNYRMLMLGDYVPLQSAVFRTRRFMHLFHHFGIDEFGGCQDWSFLLAAAKDGLEGGFLPQPTISLRFHAGQVSQQLFQNADYIDHHLAVWQYHAELGYQPERHEYLSLQQFLAIICAKANLDAIPALMRLKEMYESR